MRKIVDLKVDNEITEGVNVFVYERNGFYMLNIDNENNENNDSSIVLTKSQIEELTRLLQTGL